MGLLEDSLSGIGLTIILRNSWKLKKEEEEQKRKIEYIFSKEGKEEENARKRAALDEIGIM